MQRTRNIEGDEQKICREQYGYNNTYIARYIEQYA
jgi:hypothetical protein